MIALSDLENRFTYHPPTEGQAGRYADLRERGLDLARHINEVTPDSPEKLLAVRKLEEAVMWANAAIARNE